MQSAKIPSLFKNIKSFVFLKRENSFPFCVWQNPNKVADLKQRSTAMNKWFDSPVVKPELRSAYLRTRALLERVDSNPDARVGALEDLIERLLGLAENRCAVCGAPMDRLAGDHCSQQCFNDERVRESY